MALTISSGPSAPPLPLPTPIGDLFDSDQEKMPAPTQVQDVMLVLFHEQKMPAPAPVKMPVPDPA